MKRFTVVLVVLLMVLTFIVGSIAAEHIHLYGRNLGRVDRFSREYKTCVCVNSVKNHLHYRDKTWTSLKIGCRCGAVKYVDLPSTIEYSDWNCDLE